MKDREIKRLKEKELNEKEGQDIIHQFKKGEEEEHQRIKKKKYDANVNMQQIKVANDHGQYLKQLKLMEDKEFEDKIVQYNMEKAQKEAEYQTEKKREKDEKERET